MRFLAGLFAVAVFAWPVASYAGSTTFDNDSDGYSSTSTTIGNTTFTSGYNYQTGQRKSLTTTHIGSSSFTSGMKDGAPYSSSSTTIGHSSGQMGDGLGVRDLSVGPN